MALKTNVYVSNVTNLTEARYYAGMGVNIIGFNAHKNHASFIAPQQFDAITSWLAGISTAWQWHGDPSQELLDLLNECPADFIELATPPSSDQLSFLPKPILIRTSQSYDIEAALLLPKGLVHAIVWEGTNIEPPDNTPFSVYYKTAPGTEKLPELLNNPSIQGLALEGSPELRPGWNDFDQVAELLESLEIL